MKYLEGLRQSKKTDVAPENKMQLGSRPDQGGASTNRSATSPSNKMIDETIGDDLVALAKQLHVDLSTVKGTGRDGKIMARDIRKQASASADVLSGPFHTE